MATSSYNFDVAPQYRDAGCPSQCMSQNEYTTIGEYYGYGTDPKTALLKAMESTPTPTPSPTPMPMPMPEAITNAPSVTPEVVANISPPSTFGDYRMGVKPPQMYQMERKPIYLGSIATRFEECSLRDSYGNCLKVRQ